MMVLENAGSLENIHSFSVSSTSSNAGMSSSVESSSINTGSSPKSSSTKTTKLELSGKETIHVNRLRNLVLFTMILVTIGLSFFVYLLVDLTTSAKMKSGYKRSIERLTTSFEQIQSEVIPALASLGITFTAHAIDNNLDWPFVSLSFFQKRAHILKTQSGMLQVSVAPFVSQEYESDWEAYVVSEEPQVAWMEESLVYQENVGTRVFTSDYGINWRNDSQHKVKTWTGDTVHDRPIPSMMMANHSYQYSIPFWQMSPFISYDEVNIDILQDDRGKYALECFEKGAVVIGGMHYAPAGGLTSNNRKTATFARLLSIQARQEVNYKGDPMSYLFIPIFDSFTPERNTTAVLIGLFNWGTFLSGVLPVKSGDFDVVLHNTCYESFTYHLDKNGLATPRGKGDRHDRKFDKYGHLAEALKSRPTKDGTRLGLPFVDSTCQYSISIYPTQIFMDEYVSLAGVLVTFIVLVLSFTIQLFMVYDRLVETRQALILQKALQSTAVVSSLFPKNVRDRIMKFAGNGSMDHLASNTAGVSVLQKLRNTEDGHGHKSSMAYCGKTTETCCSKDAIADLFPNCTVLFADIAGFTAWSSTRSPEQVFTLLQNIYGAFDKIASRRKVFKVETIGDSYVAVTGLPEPQEDHALIMAKFARDCLKKINEVIHALEVRLGPDTTELTMRFGLNSGQVTGGVLMGERARFQLFGDTVNTAARMESTGFPNKIQLSQSTAELLAAAGKGKWILPREDVVTAKGKGIMQTYWLIPKPSSSHKSSKGVMHGGKVGQELAPAGKFVPNSPENSDKIIRLINWMSEVLIEYVKQIVAKNEAAGITSARGFVSFFQSKESICLDEVVESFTFAKVTNGEKLLMREKYLTIELSEAIVNQVHLYVQQIAALYNASNSFHNFDHACHVTMSAHKLMKRVVTDGTYSKEGIKPTLDQEKRDTYGILTSDPLTLFAVIFSALIHDVDHPGVSNVQLATEKREVAEHYRNKSIAEQKSFDISWQLLMGDEFNALRRAIFPRKVDMCRFRQIAANIVLATDIFDKEMGEMRRDRWEKGFGKNVSKICVGDDDKIQNIRATIVLEHIIQASDVSHTMQHWHVYLKWNKRLFEEISLAFAKGRMGSDPAAFWYQGELSFLDNYVIPLAKKIGECGVFGVSSDEYLNYAMSNRKEWEVKGKSIVEAMVESLRSKPITDSA
ncbi:adenylate/guanylate cyclase [Nitzschia inconspicua]|uniref:Adenylate/guanylate cyclase n=1 Tax=Nitzschia inconspicua TaxID=303405 RepID=A0A9K3LMR8_9STRA|nr:adenylate/guanylate cyclase [Nitzschia inconspicua]